MTKRKNDETESNTEKCFQPPLSPSQNPLIESTRTDTLANVRDSLFAIQETMDRPDGLILTTNSTAGLHLFLSCILNALQFEITCRKPNQL